MALIMLVMTESVFCFLVCLLRFGFWVFFFLVRSYFCMVWVFQFEPVKAKLNRRIAEIHFSYGPPICNPGLCVFLLETVLMKGEETTLTARRTTAPTFGSQTLRLCFTGLWWKLCSRRPSIWSTDVRKSLSLPPHSSLTHEACAVSFHNLSFYIFSDACTDEWSHRQT